MHLDQTEFLLLLTNAPSTPWPGWEPDMPPKPDRIIENEEGRQSVKNLKEIHDWEAENQKQRMIQWPIAWAEAVRTRLGLLL